MAISKQALELAQGVVQEPMLEQKLRKLPKQVVKEVMYRLILQEELRYLHLQPMPK